MPLRTPTQPSPYLPSQGPAIHLNTLHLLACALLRACHALPLPQDMACDTHSSSLELTGLTFTHYTSVVKIRLSRPVKMGLELFGWL